MKAAHGSVFKYGDNVDTDVIIPARYLNSSDPAELALHRFGRVVRTGPWQEPAEVSVPARRAQRLYFRHHLRGARPCRRDDHHGHVRAAHHPRLLDRAPRARPLRQPSCRGHYHADRLTGFLKHRGRDESCAEHRHLAAVLQLRRHGARHPARGNGRGAECFAADAARLKSSKICRGGKQTAARKKGGRKA